MNIESYINLCIYIFICQKQLHIPYCVSEYLSCNN